MFVFVIVFIFVFVFYLFLLKLGNDKLLVQGLPPPFHGSSQQVGHPVRADNVVVRSRLLPGELELQHVLEGGRYPGDLVGVRPDVDHFAVEFRGSWIPPQLDVGFCLAKAVRCKAGVVCKVLFPDPVYSQMFVFVFVFVW